MPPLDPKKPRTLSDLDVREVSMVDRAAIDRTFLVTKRLEQDHGDSDMTTKLSSAQRTTFTKASGIIRAIAQERFDLVIKTLDGLKDKGEDVTKSEVREALGTVFSNLYAAESDMTAMAKSAQDDGILGVDFSIAKAKGLDEADEKKRKEEAAEKAAKKAEDEAAEKKKAADEAEAEEKKKAAAKADTNDDELNKSIGEVIPLLVAAAKKEGAPALQLKRVAAYLAKVKGTALAKGMGLTDENVEKGFKAMTPARLAALKTAHEGLGTLLSIFQTGKAAEGDDDDAAKAKKEKGEADEAAEKALAKSLGRLETVIGTLADRVETIETTRKAASGEETDEAKAKAKAALEKSGKGMWDGIL